MEMTRDKLAGMIDHSALKAAATESDIRRLCQEAMEYRFACVSTNSAYVALAAKLLAGSGVKVDATVGFPLGAASTAAKVCETEDSIHNGAEEIDMVMNVGAVKSGNDALAERDIAAVVEAAGAKVTKVIIETCYLSEEEKRRACAIVRRVGPTFIKTSTGFGAAGATVEDIRLLKELVGDGIQVKAAGGIDSCRKALELLAAGATRLGLSRGPKIIQEFQAT
ncbi:MAG: deoxyribose-phosphate aldolase [Planctomycetota bacterium]|nr:deoxyribose-phosphate aldolase [Planctomycetota bacterium]